MRKISPTVRDRRAEIVDAARFLGLRFGMKGVSVEAIAREARVAKPTLYSLFANKDEIFAAVMEELIAEMKRVFDEALATEGSPVDKISRALTAKHGASMRLLEGSPHAAELYSEHDRVAGPQFKELEMYIRAALLRELGRRKDAEQVAHILMAASYGLVLRAVTIEQLGKDIERLTRGLVNT